MEYSSVQLNDLPDEILMIIFKKLCKTEVLYSLTNLNIRLNKIIRDSIFTNYLSLVRFASNHFTVSRSLLTYYIYPLPDQILDRFCLHILPKIHEKVKWLDLEPLSMERILLATNYPNLFGIALYNTQIERALQLFSDERIFTYTFRNQILSFVIDINTNEEQSSRIYFNRNGQSCSREVVTTFLFTHILTTFPNLQSLYFGPSSSWCQYLSFYMPSSVVISSTLSELYVCLTNFMDCLYLLDGRFNQLRIFHVNIDQIICLDSVTNNKEKLPNLTWFTLYCDWGTTGYDGLILPLLHRMSNLEKLDLCLEVYRENTFIDGNNLKLNIIDYMPLLNKFTFNIRSCIHFNNQINLPSNEYIQQTFKDFENEQIISSIDYFSEDEYSQCHIYSYPYQSKIYNKITNNFSGGIFKYVCKISLFDERPFEHEFFLRISQSFPFIKELTIINNKSQNNKQFRRSKTQNQELSIIQYPHLSQLDLSKAHKDYYEQFLLDTKTCLPNNVSVYMDYQLVEKVTHNFRRKTTRSNCMKIFVLSFRNPSKFPQHFKDYFPHTRIC